MKILSYTAWLAENTELVKKLEKEFGEVKDCYECDGTGEHECECGHVHECNHCEGTGKQDGVEDVADQLRSIYDHTRNVELANLQKWGGVVQLEELSNPYPQGYVGEPAKPDGSAN